MGCFTIGNRTIIIDSIGLHISEMEFFKRNYQYIVLKKGIFPPRARQGGVAQMLSTHRVHTFGTESSATAE
ncbi:hypothetical protein AVEN_50239-1 [Araneus ventricosus]|uniref:Uncharacterized protein n=1 Tax=Araneus ventricosus TaxID=182803 RepID=A0A4Y2E4Q1_ARAVE|nr:hypothetical protein AVEN_50239-1 [Araneus ventricosus]